MKKDIKNKKTFSRYLIGIDEAGRGPLAGPVAVGAFVVKSQKALRRFRGVKDSKQLSPKKREEWFARVKAAAKNGEVGYKVSFSNSWTIDSKGLSPAIKSALARSLVRLERDFIGLGCDNAKILLDGSLFAPKRYVDQTTIIDGDAKEPIIALASICAKVLRDRRMVKAAGEFPGYGFEIHKGYGTKAHYKALKKHGLTPMHRRSFLGKIRAK